MADLALSIIAQIPRDIITEISKPHIVQLKENKLVAAITDLGHLRYGRCKLTPLGLRLEEVWVDAVGLPHLTGKIKPCMNRTLHDVEMWHMDPRDERIIGPKEFIFPHMKGWTIDGEKVRMDGLHIKQLTRTQTQRRVLPPPAVTTWQLRYPAKTIPWGKVWRITCFYCTPRDQITWLKLYHRNLYVCSEQGPHHTGPGLQNGVRAA